NPAVTDPLHTLQSRGLAAVVIHRNAGARTGQANCGLVADAARGAGDERHLPAEIEHLHCSRVYAMEVTLYTRRDCPLCDDAKGAIHAAGLTAQEVDIDLDPELQRRFTNDVP